MPDYTAVDLAVIREYRNLQLAAANDEKHIQQLTESATRARESLARAQRSITQLEAYAREKGIELPCK